MLKTLECLNDAAAVIDHGPCPTGGRNYSVLLKDGAELLVGRPGRPDTVSGRSLRSLLRSAADAAWDGGLWVGPEEALLGRLSALGVPVLAGRGGPPYPYPAEYGR